MADEPAQDELPDPGARAGKTDDESAVAPASRRWLPGRHASAAVIGVLTLLLGFGIAVQVHQNSSSDALDGLRDDDLIGILDNQDARSERLRQQIAQLQDNLRTLQDSGNRSAAARQQAEQEQQTLGILVGTIPATGPGVVVTISDSRRRLDGEDLLDVVEELRGAGAEAIQFGAVRVSTDTAFEGGKGSVSVDGRVVPAPYRVLAIGAPKTLDTALNIPGGVAATIRTLGGGVSVQERSTVEVTATRTAPNPKYAKPSH